jgi:hypothetical protein
MDDFKNDIVKLRKLQRKEEEPADDLLKSTQEMPKVLKEHIVTHQFGDS